MGDARRIRGWLGPDPTARPWGSALALAAGATAAIVGVRFLLEPLLGGRAPLLLFTIAVMFSAWRGGWRAGLAATVLSIFAGGFLFLPPYGVFFIEDRADLLRQYLFFIVGVVITALNHQLRAMRQQDRALVEELARVRQRTDALERTNSELRLANDELEGYSYAVSHDLRAPLRAISGTAARLREARGDGISREELDEHEALRLHVRKMVNLIDDLLQLSRATRGQVRRVPVDLTALARRLLHETSVRHPRPRAETHVEEGLVVTADPGMMSILMDNLIRNAWKFTRDADPPCIEIGRTETERGPAFFVRDNGIGFDPEQAGMLFRPFHRLHGEAEYEGTGIGLASCKRIVDRHQGEIWTEAAPGRGATFYFRIGLPDAERASGDSLKPSQ